MVSGKGNFCLIPLLQLKKRLALLQDCLFLANAPKPDICPTYDTVCIDRAVWVVGYFSCISMEVYLTGLWFSNFLICRQQKQAKKTL